MTTAVETPSTSGTLPLKEIPGSYGWPFFGALKDRLDFFWFQGEKEFWESRVKKYKSTVFRTNVAPSPPFFPTSSVIMLLDQKSFPILFDVSKVEKKDLLLANYMPSISYYGGIRPCVYLDPSEERHTKLKSFFVELNMSNAKKWIPETERAMKEAFPVWEQEMQKKGKAQVNSEVGHVTLKVLMRTIVGRDPAEPGEASLKTQGPFFYNAWLDPQLAPIASAGLPHLLEELLIHTFRIPYLFISPFHKKIEKFFKTYAGHLLELAETKYGLERNDTLHNLIFMIGFNAFGGLNLLFPSIIGYVGQAGNKLHDELASEVREAVKAEGGLTVRAIERMELLKSTVYEVLRMSPPVPYQYARAKTDLTIESHDASFRVKKGELLGGCQPFAERDPNIFNDPDTFIASRFVGEDGKRLLRYVLWGNGPADGKTTPDNKQCVANELVPFLSHIFLASFFLRYDSFTTEKPVVRGNSITYSFSSFTKAS